MWDSSVWSTDCWDANTWLFDANNTLNYFLLAHTYRSLGSRFMTLGTGGNLHIKF